VVLTGNCNSRESWLVSSRESRVTWITGKKSVTHCHLWGSVVLGAEERRSTQTSYFRCAICLRERFNSSKAVIDRRLRPRCCDQGTYCRRPKSSPVRPLACSCCSWHYCAQLITKPKARVHCASAGRRRRATLAYEQM